MAGIEMRGMSNFGADFHPKGTFVMLADTSTEIRGIGGGTAIRDTSPTSLHLVNAVEPSAQYEERISKALTRSERIAQMSEIQPTPGISRKDFFGIIEYPEEKFTLAEQNIAMGVGSTLRALKRDFVLDPAEFHRGYGVRQPYVSFTVHHGVENPNEYTFKMTLNWSEIGGMNLGVENVPTLLPPEAERKNIKSVNPLRNGEPVDFTKPLDVFDAEAIQEDPRSTQLVKMDIITTPSKPQNVELLTLLAVTPSLALSNSANTAEAVA